jgi:hypothetical protein
VQDVLLGVDVGLGDHGAIVGARCYDGVSRPAASRQVWAQALDDERGSGRGPSVRLPDYAL